MKPRKITINRKNKIQDSWYNYFKKRKMKNKIVKNNNKNKTI